MTSVIKNKLIIFSLLLFLFSKYDVSKSVTHTTIVRNSVKTNSIDIFPLFTDAMNKGIERFNMKKTIISQGNFNWYFKNGNDNFNLDTYNAINVRVQASDESKFLADFSSSGGYTNSYAQVLNLIHYKPEVSKTKALNYTLNTLANKLVFVYENRFGKITDLQILTANSQTNTTIKSKLDYILHRKIAYEWSGRKMANGPPLLLTELQKNKKLKTILTDIPTSSETIIEALQSYFSVATKINSILTLNSESRWALNQLKNNVQYPTERNGGIKTVNPNTGEISQYNVAYTIKNTIENLTNQLKVDKKTMNINILVNHPKPIEVIIITSFQKKIDTISYTLKDSISKIQIPYGDTVIKQGTINSFYDGIVQVNISPLQWDQETNTGWHNNLPIIEALRNEGTTNSGYHFSTKPPFNFKAFKNGGDFGYITNLLICDSVIGNISINDQQNTTNNNSMYRPQTNLLLKNNKSESIMYRLEESIFPKLEVPILQQTAIIIGGTFHFLKKSADY